MCDPKSHERVEPSKVLRLVSFACTRPKGHHRHILVKGNSSPDDPSLKEYWQQRNLAKAKNHTKSIQKIAQKQGCVCPICGDSLFNGEEIHKHHEIPRIDGGKHTYSNFQLVHLYCHQQIHFGTT